MPRTYAQRKTNAETRAGFVCFSSLLCPRVRLVVDVLELLFYDVGIDLGGGDIRVAQHLLDGAQVRAVFQQVRRKAVAQGVRSYVLLDARLFLIGLDYLPEALACLLYTSATGRILAGVAAGLAALGLVLESTLSVELLLAGGEHELLTALFAYQDFVFEHVLPSLLMMIRCV